MSDVPSYYRVRVRCNGRPDTRDAAGFHKGGARHRVASFYRRWDTGAWVEERGTARGGVSQPAVVYVADGQPLADQTHARLKHINSPQVGNAAAAHVVLRCRCGLEERIPGPELFQIFDYVKQQGAHDVLLWEIILSRHT